MSKNKILLWTAGVAFSSASSMSFAADSLTNAITSGKVSVDARLRYEIAENDDAMNARDAEALTLRTRLGYKTADFHGLTGYVEFEDIRVVAGFDEYSPESNGFDTINDPEVTEVNQSYLRYQITDAMAVTAGRQRIILDNARFVGNVGWRQDEQTYDAVRFDYDADNLTFTAAYLDNINGVGREESDQTNSLLTNVGYKFPVGKLSGYYYALENNNKNDVQNNGSELNTVGVRFAGKANVSESVGLIYLAEVATQEYENGALENETDYTHFKLGVDLGFAQFAVAQEVLGSDDGARGFATPLATGHRFNGWADKFLATPADGLEDTYVEAKFDVAEVKFKAVYHEFAGDDSGQDLGSEVDFIASYNITENYNVGVKFAVFSGENGQTDSDKAWLWGQLKF